MCYSIKGYQNISWVKNRYRCLSGIRISDQSFQSMSLYQLSYQWLWRLWHDARHNQLKMFSIVNNSLSVEGAMHFLWKAIPTTTLGLYFGFKISAVKRFFPFLFVVVGNSGGTRPVNRGGGGKRGASLNLRGKTLIFNVILYCWKSIDFPQWRTYTSVILELGYLLAILSTTSSRLIPSGVGGHLSPLNS